MLAPDGRLARPRAPGDGRGLTKHDHALHSVRPSRPSERATLAGSLNRGATLRNVNAVRVGPAGIPRQGISSGSAATAYVAVLADAAPAFEMIGIAHAAKGRMVLVDVDYRVVGKTPAV